MGQVWTVATNEFRNAFRGRVFLVITALFLFLSVLSVYVGSTTKAEELRAYGDIIAALKSQGVIDLPAPPQIFPLAILHNIVEYVSMVGAVLAIFLGFDSFSGERRRGTMALILTRPVYRDQLFNGKLLGGGMVIGSLLLVTLAFNGVLFGVVSGVVPTASELGRLGVFTVMAFAYMMSFYVGSLFVSLRSNSPSLGFLVMLVAWVVVSFVVPELAASQKAYAYSLNATTQVVTQLPSDTAVSRAIEAFSPTAHFRTIGNDLLQAVPKTAEADLVQVLSNHLLELVYMLVPGIALLAGSYVSFLREGD